ncbi:GDP-mannose 4,6-dehydratase [Segnochrobactrum spirostomi]|uniref:NAD-dependent epimerase/dehydratase family protein n=1 Tax=Segnochrobactrum spirostomi TaxID=2608987 RepID=A0A6A7Y795_9HYPH|nr:GDP-mannose 4,6-dehydratase [Segnochrobactrum spirostomi]MQT13971.1 NAD-dependent epimerase/dehydratase family protein [Segnochrobactrum spirostomi]
MRILLTGALGFVAPFAQQAIADRLGGDIEWLPTSQRSGTTALGEATTALDITAADDAAELVRRFRPHAVLHLAGVTSLADAAGDPFGAWRVNVFGTLNLLNALIAHAPGSLFVSVGTGLAYGAAARHGRPLGEQDLLEPQNEYGVTKAAADLAVGAAANRGVKVIRLRPFNHTGRGQPEKFVVPSFVGQIARIERGVVPPVMRVGNLDVIRDFLDVRDVAACYAEVIARAGDVPSGTIFNIASGAPRTVRSILEMLIAASGAEITVETDPALVRPNELATYVGDATAIRDSLGWAPRIDFADTLRDMLAAARDRV